MWARTWVPRPTTKRPSVASASIHAAWAVSIGLRGKATATLVPRVSVEVARAAAEHIEKTGLAPLGQPQGVEPGRFDPPGHVLHLPQRPTRTERREDRLWFAHRDTIDFDVEFGTSRRSGDLARADIDVGVDYRPCSGPSPEEGRCPRSPSPPTCSPGRRTTRS